jgi:hypothetical protein
VTALDKAGLVALADTGCDDDNIWRDVPVDALRAVADAMTAPTVAEIARIAAWNAYLDSVKNELAVCPHCETWLQDDCLNGRGCPTPDGANGALIRAYLQECQP